jgi:hypothetical protein
MLLIMGLNFIKSDGYNPIWSHKGFFGPPPAFGGRRPYKILPTRIQKLFASDW